MAETGQKRKLQVSNGHYLLFDELAKLLNAIASLKKSRKITMSDLENESGLPFRQVRNRVSIGRAMGLFHPKQLLLSPVGLLVAKHDLFCSQGGTLEWLHYKAASSYTNLVWYETFNTFLPHHSPHDYEGWLRFFRNMLAADYTEHSLKDHLGKEVRFIIDAYTSAGFSKLQLLYEATDGRLSRRRYAHQQTEVLAAMIYDFAQKHKSMLIQVEDLTEQPGSPGLLFAMDEGSLLHSVEDLHNRGWLCLETTHNLRQVRLMEGFVPLEFLKAYFEKKSPVPTEQGNKIEERMLL